MHQGNNCGVAVKSAAFIVGGNDTELGEFPWMVLLGKDKPTGRVSDEFFESSDFFARKNEMLKNWASFSVCSASIYKN